MSRFGVIYACKYCIPVVHLCDYLVRLNDEMTAWEQWWCWTNVNTINADYIYQKIK